MTEILEETNKENLKELYQKFIPENRKKTDANIFGINQDYDGETPFIGSQPIQIQRKTLSRLLDIHTRITPKIDGVRYLLAINNDNFVFINRSKEFFHYNYSEKINRYNKPDISLLVDAEVVYDNKNPIKLQIFVFDLIAYQIGKQGMIYKEHKKPYKSRMNKLFNFFTKDSIFQHYNNNSQGKLKFYYKASLTYSNVYHCKSLKDYYNTWNAHMNFENDEEIPPFDGLIFNNLWSRYFFPPKVAHGQYKWKPQDKLTIDLKYDKGKVYDSKDKELKINGKKISIEKKPKDKKGKLINNQVCEFVIVVDNKTIKLYYDRPREKSANSLLTINSVIEAYENPVNIEDLYNLWTTLAGNPNGNLQSFKGLCSWMIGDIETKSIDDIEKGKYNVEDVNNRAHNLVKLFFLYGGEYNFIKNEEELLKKYKEFIEAYKNGRYTSLTNEELESLIRFNTVYEALGEDVALGYWEEGLFEVDKSKRKPISSSFRCFIELNKEFDCGFKKKKKDDDNIMRRIKNIGDKEKDCYYLLNKLRYSNGVKERINMKRVHEFISVFGTNKVERYVYEYDKNTIATPTTSQYKLLSLEDLEMSDNISLFDKEYMFDYSFNLRFTKTKRKSIHNPPIERDPFKLSNINKRRFKKIYSIKNSQYFKLRIVFLKEWSKRINKETNEVRWDKKPQRKSFIELEFNFEKFMNDHRKEDDENIKAILVEYFNNQIRGIAKQLF